MGQLIGSAIDIGVGQRLIAKHQRYLVRGARHLALKQHLDRLGWAEIGRGVVPCL